jgi:HSP20 family protein
MLYNTFDAILSSFSDDQYYRNNYITIKPKANIYKNENSYLFEMAVPGFSREDLNITLEENSLSVSADLKNTKSKNVSEYKEFDYSKFFRSWKLPDGLDLDKTEASYESGILKINIPIKSNKTFKKIKIE